MSRVWNPLGEAIMNNRKNYKAHGMGYLSTLTMILIVLKLTDNLAWSWIWVLAPIWITCGFFFLCFGMIMIVGRLKKGYW